MTTLYRNRYRIESARLPGWDYAGPGWYFVTLCTHNRACVLGDVRNGRVHLSSIGQIVAEEWMRTKTVRYNVRLDAWVVMPNHLHGIVGIAPAMTTGDSHLGAGAAVIPDTPAIPDTPVETPRRGVSTFGNANLPEGQRPRGLQPNSLGAIVGQFKSVCTKRIRGAGHADFAWQTRFYDRIIRDRHALDRVRRYIAQNPSRWERDRENPVGVFI